MQEYYRYYKHIILKNVLEILYVKNMPRKNSLPLNMNFINSLADALSINRSFVEINPTRSTAIHLFNTV